MRRDMNVMCSGAFVRTLVALLPPFESETGLAVRVTQGPSLGTSPRAIPARLRGGEQADLVILFDEAVQVLCDEGLVRSDTRVGIAASAIAAVVRHGEPMPDIGTPDALRKAFLAVRSFAYSSSASGLYVSSVLLERLDLPPLVGRKGIRVDGEPVAEVVARGKAEIGFQQLSELLPVAGVAVIGRLPDGLQQISRLSAAVATAAREPRGAIDLSRYLASTRVRPALNAAGLDPYASPVSSR